ncbi:endo-1,4-beta-xylanase [Quadrisphaera sp. DSM 44207]|uniref:endo-1,4-beta-xylanase n=1 Tax=Quadrisphaera sp. DSM 44207 TaxID=1881057 RepID=UPI0008820C97|nr:endo-1,4-beta-xylanase [Quadrisphaera sp. DSM 44207]SDQ64815.1 Endo-1,4-beta-xylanase, GH35 family [Quadrisphaera sp. DSM 44207]
MSPQHRSPAPDPQLGHRTAQAAVTVTGPDGRVLADADVVVEQTRHAIAFGNIGFDFIGYANGETEADPDSPFGGAPPSLGQRLAELYVGLFDTATLPFYWGGFEPERGRPDTARLLRTARWFAERGVRLKGHPLVWHTVTADWLRELPTDEVEAAVRARVRREVGDFAGVVDTWDAINEVVIMPVFANEERTNGITRLCRERGRIATIRTAFEEARATNPRATLLLNDFDTSTAYECLIEGVLEAGVQVDALGLQSHMHQGYWGEEKTLRVLERFSRYGLPIHFTESSLVSGHLMPPEVEDLNDYRIPSWPSTPEGEERQAEEVVRHYRTLLSHPSVQAITYWGLTDEGAWLGAPIGLVRADGTPKPSYDALRGLVRGEWWLPPTTLRTDAEGRVRVRGFLGDYRVTAGGASAPFALAQPGEVSVEVALGR